MFYTYKCIIVGAFVIYAIFFKLIVTFFGSFFLITTCLIKCILYKIKSRNICLIYYSVYTRRACKNWRANIFSSKNKFL